MLVSDLTQKVIRRLGMQYGTAVQYYAEDLVQDMIESAFVRLFDDEWWELYSHTVSTTVAANGEVYQDFTTAIMREEDIKHIFYDNDNVPLPRFPTDGNLEVMRAKSGRPYFYNTLDVDPGKMFELIPHGEDDIDVYVSYRTLPTMPISPTDDLLLDSQALIMGACWDYAEDDGANPGAIDKFQRLYVDRVNQVKALRNTRRIPLRGVQRHSVGHWYEYP